MKKINFFKLGLLLLGLGVSLNPTKIWSYPNFIGYGYTSCTVCHYNPYGNGPLTDYGRALGASTISDDTFWFGKRKLNEIGEKSGFLYSKAFTTRVRPSLDYRGMYLKTRIGEESSQAEFINMDANISLVLRLGPKDYLDKFIAAATIGYAPLPRSGSRPDDKTYRSREHYIGYRISNNWGIYLGLMDKLYGLRIVNHEAYSRLLTSNTMNDQTHGLVIHYTSPKMDVALQPFLGNLGEEDDVRQKGLSSNFEYTINRKFRPGLSLQMSSSEYTKKTAYALHARAGFGEGNSIMLELGQVAQENISTAVSTTSRYFLIQTHALLRKGLFIFNTIEYLNQNTDEDDRTLRWGPGLQYFIFQGVEIRFDLTNSRFFSSTASVDDLWNLTGQVHLWF